MQSYTRDDKYTFNVNVKPQYTSEQRKAIAEADKWLDNISAKNINIEKYFKTSADDDAHE